MALSNLVGGDTPSVHAEFPSGVPPEFYTSLASRFCITRPSVTDRVSRRAFAEEGAKTANGVGERDEERQRGGEEAERERERERGRPREKEREETMIDMSSLSNNHQFPEFTVAECSNELPLKI